MLLSFAKEDGRSKLRRSLNKQAEDVDVWLAGKPRKLHKSSTEPIFTEKTGAQDKLSCLPLLSIDISPYCGIFILAAHKLNPPPALFFFLFDQGLVIAARRTNVTVGHTAEHTPHARGDRRGRRCRWSVRACVCRCASALTPPAFCCRTSRAEARLPRA